MTTTASSFHPPTRVLLGPGPSNVHPRVLAAMSRPTIGHLDPSFITLMDDIKSLLQYAFRTRNALTLPVSGPGSAGKETCVVNLVEPGETVVVCRNGVFGGRLMEAVERCGGKAVPVDFPWGEPVDPQRLADALKAHPEARIVAFVHAETSTGAQSDAKTLAAVARDHDCLSIVDAVTSLGGTPLEVDGWGLDAVYSGSQKCLSCPPGLSPITVSERALDKIRTRKTRVQSWFLDLGLVMSYWGSGVKRVYHHTAPVNALYALHESLVMLREEGLERAWERHLRNHLALRAGLEAMGIRFVVREDARLPQLNAVSVPEGVRDAELRTRLLELYNLEIGAGLGQLAGQVWRIGLMGHSSNLSNVMLCLNALEEVLDDMHAPIARDVALAAAQASVA